MTSIELIKALREKTGASLQACKKALEEANGDETLAIETLRKKGEAKAASRSDRSTSEGVIATAIKNGKGVIISLGCETDFVAKNSDFVTEAQTLANTFLEEGEGYDANEKIQALNLKMGEKVELVAVKIFEGST
ncbi:MAG: translation elongation factor Ts, partial [Candidatus Peregrinibacteria bacterium]|nr:translation elongation factor Ts [Candidatus Peregrinibacteria bacterium]